MITENIVMKYILDSFPEFQTDWDRHLEFWEGDKAGLCNDISEFASFYIDNAGKFDEKRKEDIFILIEKLLNDGDNYVKDAVATCFLENLLNSVSAERLSTDDLVQYVGKESRAYCNAWDEFTGVPTQGLNGP